MLQVTEIGEKNWVLGREEDKSLVRDVSNKVKNQKRVPEALLSGLCQC